MRSVSVIVPVFNAADYLAQALPRLLAQTLGDIEIVIVDDASTDETADIVAAFAHGRTNVVAVRQPQNSGVAPARQRGVAECSGDYVWFVDADDDWSDNAAAVMYAKAIDAELDVLVAGARFVYSDGSSRPLPAPRGAAVTGLDSFRMLLTGVLTGHLWNKLFKRTLLEQIEYVPARTHSDLAMVADALSRAGTVGFIPDIAYHYRLREGSIITSRSSRAESLQLVGKAVERAARRLPPDIIGSDDYRYFYNRYILLSSIKDGVQGPYSPAESARIIASLRSRLSTRELAVFARRGDGRRLLLGVAAKTSLPAYRALLQLAER